ncbi:putative mismatched base pair and cruciform DNA recognition protein [Lyophyllum shimeji]|uniref:Mismatched base pair and cruciform DNA recognition protein n=1 Tax=Lyophyllum shimeji TaxID=47721 RepID=A0A9P3PVH6_LYOSH|nr:putative mismatched base pair and cruciform DNA recognition protein [Lyophyllum shimeji]
MSSERSRSPGSSSPGSSWTSSGPSKASGQYHQLKGSVVETVGDVTGSQSWKESGQQERAQGEAEYKAAQAKEYIEGAMDRIGGKKESVLGALSGDRPLEARGNLRQSKGEMQQEVNKPI